MSAAEERPPVAVEQAVQAALAKLPSFLGGAKPELVRVEEVLLPRGEGSPYRITLSYLEVGVAEPRHPAVEAMEGMWRRAPPLERVLRVVDVDPFTGEATAMRRHDRA